MGNTIDDTLYKICQGSGKTKPKSSSYTVGNSPNKVVRLPSAVQKEDKVPLDKRWTKRSRKAVGAVSLVIIQVIPESQGL
jgi:hypothetical protein